MSIAEAQDSLICEINSLEDGLMQYDLLLGIAAEGTDLTDDEKTEQNRISGCQGNSWIILDTDGENLFIRSDSESLIIRGILGIYGMLLNGRSLREVVDTKLCFIEKTALKNLLETDRFKAIQRVADQIRSFCFLKLSEKK